MHHAEAAKQSELKIQKYSENRKPSNLNNINVDKTFSNTVFGARKLS
jgi:hypothetical protein